MPMIGRAAAAAAALILALLVIAVTAASAPAAVHTGKLGMQLITSFEGESATVYADPVGVATQCYGATGAELLTLPPIATHAECVAELHRALARTYDPPVRDLFRRPRGVLAGLFSQHRFDALVSATYNLGTGLVRCAYASMCAAIAARSPTRICDTLLLYDTAGGRVLLGLQRRRAAERALCRRPMSRFELFPAAERRWISTFDRLRGHRSTAAATQRRQLQTAMRKRARRIDQLMHRQHDGLSHRRITRLAALRRRIR